MGGITGQGRLFGTAYGAGGGEAAEAREAWGRGISQVLGETPPLTARLCLPVSKKKQRQWIGPTGLNQTGEEQRAGAPPPPPPTTTTMGLGLVLGLARGLLAPGPQEAPWGGGVSGLAPSPGSRFLPPR